MRSFYKNSFLVAVVSILLGLGLCIAGIVGGGTELFRQMVESGDFNISFGDDGVRLFGIPMFDNGDWKIGWDESDDDWDDEETGAEQKGYYSLSEYQIENLNLQIGAASCEVIYDNEVDGYSISIKPGRGNEDVEYGVEDNTLYMKCSTDISILSGKVKPNKIVITIPEKKVYNKVDLAIGAGSVEIESPLEAKDIQLEIGAGNIEADKLTAENNLKCEVGAGNLEIEEIKTGNLKVQCEAGRMIGEEAKISKNLDISCDAGMVELDLAEKEKSFNFDLSCAVGKIRIGDESHGGLDFSQKINNLAERSCTVDCNAGSVTVDFE